MCCAVSNVPTLRPFKAAMGNIGKPNSSFHFGPEVSYFLSVDEISLTVFHCGDVLGLFLKK